MKNFFLSIVVLGSCIAQAQVGIGTTSPAASAALDITSTTQGFLPPRMTAAERDAIADPAQGLMVYCTNCGTNGEAQFYNGAAWVNLVGGTATATTVPIPNVTNPATNKVWMDRNLGATQVATSSTDASSYGDLYQWGRGDDGHEKRSSNTRPTRSSTDNPGHGDFITSSVGDWRSTQNDNLWQVVNGENNPCPSGYRLPTIAEWDGERTTWGTQNADGAFASQLKLPMAGYRVTDTGSLSGPGALGVYWSSTVSLTQSRKHGFSSNNSDLSPFDRTAGFSVRCIKN